jgi:hypothetical protein
MPSIGAHAFSAGVLFFFGVAIAGCDELVGFGDLPPQATPAPALSPECFADAPVAFEPKPTITLRVPFTENGGTPVSTPLEVKACKLFDHECTPLLGSAATNDEGIASIEVPANPGTGEFGGMLRIDQPGYFKGLTLFRPPPRVDLTLPPAIAVTDSVVVYLTGLYKLSAETIGERGHLAIIPVMCDRSRVAGIEPILPSDQNLADESTKVFVRSNGGLVPDEGVTTKDGVVVFINLLIPEDKNFNDFYVSLVDRETRAPFVPPQAVRVWRGELTTLVVAPGL